MERTHNKVESRTDSRFCYLAVGERWTSPGRTREAPQGSARNYGMRGETRLRVSAILSVSGPLARGERGEDMKEFPGRKEAPRGALALLVAEDLSSGKRVPLMQFTIGRDFKRHGEDIANVRLRLGQDRDSGRVGSD